MHNSTQPEPQTVGLQECTFTFGAHPRRLALRALCRRGPEGKEQLSLTLQDGEPQVIGATACRGSRVASKMAG
jgi:hypothetical protein